MAQQLPSTPSVRTISDLYGAIKREDLILQPEFQRKLVWNDKHKEAFIDTILNGFPFPEIYIAQSGVDLELLQTQQVVVDGQQRLSTIIDYIETSSFCKKVCKYADLTAEEKKQFLNYNVVIRDLADANEATIKEIFRRINKTKYSLTAVEIHNAIYDGEFISTAKELLCAFEKMGLQVFSETEMSRMGDLHFMLLLMATFEEGGYYAGDKYTEDYIEKYNNEYPNSEAIKERFLYIIDVISRLELSNESIWYRKSNFFTLFIELTKATEIPDMLKEKLQNLEHNIVANKDNRESDYGAYYAAMYTGTNQRTARVTRGSIFKKYILE